MNEDLEKKILNMVVNGKIACHKALEFADQNNLTSEEVGEYCNSLKIKIISCQLGCFK